MDNSLVRRIKDSLNKPGLIGALGGPVYRIYYLLKETFIPSLRLARRLDREFDSRFDVCTKGWISPSELGINSDNVRFANYYHAVRPTEFQEVLNDIRIGREEFTFIDFGSGMGRALLLASELPFKKIIGVEFSPRLHQIAQENIRKYKSESQKCRDIEAVCMDVTQYSIPQEKAVFYIYNPFKEEVMAKVLNNIQKSLEENPREVFILYYNPVCVRVFERFTFEEVRVTKRYAVFKSPVDTK